MSTTIDQRIVEMRFDNKQFEQNVSTTMSSLDKLKQKLRLDGVSKGLEDVNAAAKNVDMSMLGSNVEKVGLKFSGLYTIADQALRNITNSAINAGTRIVKALTIEPITTGFKEYETQINAIQTILANTESKGTTLDDVNGALDELNAYADKTIYNFTEMTRNIGTFTAAGVDLDTSVAAIKGIANLAAVSGSTSQQASTAMYQLSQALSSGTVRLMDWNSVVNAGMGGQVFQDALKETARVHGIAIDDLIKKEGSFRESLSQGWLSSEILTETLAKFTGDLNAAQLKTMGYTEEQIEGILKMGQTANDAATKVKTFSQLFDTLKEAAQSGWAQSWEIIVGDFEEAKVLLTKVSDTIGGLIGKSAEARNDLLENWKVLGGRTELIDAVTYAFEAVMSIVQAVSEAMKEVFPPLTSEKLVAFCTGLKELAQRFAEVFKVNGKTTTTFNNLKRTLKGVFAVVDIVRQIFVALVKAVGKVFGVTGKVGEGLLYFTAIIGDWLVAISDALEYSGILEFAIGGIGHILEFVIGIFKNFGRAISESFVFKAATEGLNAFLGLIDRTADRTEVLVDAAEGVKAAWLGSGLYKFLIQVWDIIKTIGSGIAKMFSGVGRAISEAFGEGDFGRVFDIINGLLSGGFIVGLIALIKKIKDAFDTLDLLKTVKDVLGNVGDAFQSFQNKMNADVLKSIAVAIAILVGSLLVLTFLDENKLHNALAALVVLMGALTLMMTVLKKGQQLGKGAVDLAKLSSSLITLSTALLIAAGAFLMLGSMSWGEIARGLTATLGIFAILTLVHIALGKWANGSADMKQGAKVMRSMAITLLLVCAPLAILGAMKWESIAKGLTGIAGVLVIMAGVQIMISRLAGNSSNMLAGAAAMTIMALAINLLIPPLLVFGLMPWQMLLKAGSMLIVLLAALGAVQILYGKLGNGAMNMLAGASAIAIMAASISLLIPILTLFATIPLPSLIKAIGGVIVLIAALGGVQILYGKLANGVGNMLAGATAIAIMSASLNLLIPVLLTLGLMSLPSLLQSVISLVAILAALGGALVLIGRLGGGGLNVLASAGAIAVMAVALGLLTVPLLMLGSMSIKAAITSIAMLAAALGVLVGAAFLVAPVISVLVSFGVAVALIGVGLLASGAGLIAFGVGLSAVAVGIINLVGAAAALVGGLGTVCVALTALIAAALEGIIRGIGAGIVALCEILLDSLPLIADVAVALVVAICDVLIGCAPKIVETLAILVLKICEASAKFIPPIVSALLQLITGVINALAQEIPALIESVVGLIFAIIEGCIKALGGMDTSALMQALMNVGMLTAIIAALAAIAILTPAAMVGVVGMALVVAELAIVLAAIGQLTRIPGLQEAIGDGGNLLQTVGTAIGQFIGGLVGGFAKGATADLPEIANNLSGFADNIGKFLDIAPSLSSALAGLAGASIVDGISRIFNFGQSSMDKLKQELPKLGEGLAGFSDALGGRSFDNVSAAAEGAKHLTEVMQALPREGGLWGAIAGNKAMGTFGEDLKTLGSGLAGFSDVIGDRKFDNIGNAVDAAIALTEIAEAVPNSGGLTAWVSGENSIAKFGDELISLGNGIVGFAETVKDCPDVGPAITAAKSLVELTNQIPNEGGMVSWFVGNTAISKYSDDLARLGTGICNFATNIGESDPAKIAVAADAAKHIADLTNMLPRQEGIAQWFAGESSLSKFGEDMGALGAGLKSFSDNTAGITPETVKAAADAALTLAGITEFVPTEGGIGAWFSGEQSLSKFGEDMGALGVGLKNFAVTTTGITPETVKAAADAAVALAGITEYVPVTGGVAAWFTGEQSLSKFGEDMSALGTGLNSFAVNTTNVDPEKVKGAALAAVELAKMTEHIPNSGGVVAWFAGDVSVSKFADQLPALGKGLSGFVSGLGDADMSGVAKAAEAAKALAEMTQYVPNEGGIKSWFTGETSISKFGNQLPDFGKAIKGFSDSIKGMSPENVVAGANAAKTLAEMTDIVPSNSKKIVTFGDNLKSFGTKMGEFISHTKTITTESVQGANTLVTLAKEVATIDSDKIKGVATALKELTKAAKDMEKDIKSDMKDAGKKAVEGYISGMNDKLKDAKTAISDLVDAVADKASDKASAFESAGKDCVKGFANGIKNNKYLATDAGSAVGKAALEAAKKAVDSNSPSKEFMKLGRDSDSGFAIGLTRYADTVYDSGYEVGRSGLNGLSDSISKISRLVENGMDPQPTIRPVLDLSDIESGAARIGGIFANTPLGISANLGAIKAMMNSRGQNGSTEDVVGAIKKLRDDIANMKTTTNIINGVTYDDGSNINEAVRTLIRAAMIERRV